MTEPRTDSGKALVDWGHDLDGLTTGEIVEALTDYANAIEAEAAEPYRRVVEAAQACISAYYESGEGGGGGDWRKAFDKAALGFADLRDALAALDEAGR